MRQNILLAPLMATILFSFVFTGTLPVFGAIDLDLNRGDEITIQPTLGPSPNLESQKFVYIVQVEDQEGYTVFLAFQEDKVASDVSQTFIFNWRSETEGTYSVRTFVWSSFENPIPVDSLVREQRIDVNGESRGTCTGSAECFTGIVTRIVDGDTLDVGDTRIRLSLVNTPEINEQGYETAKDFTSSLCPVGSRVLVDQDDDQLEDRFGRMVAIVTCVDNKILNSELLNNGHAGILTEYCAESEFASEDWVQQYGCGVTEIPVEEDMNCDPSYPDVCIPPPPPDLDCGEISYRNFKVLQPDPHRFDGDKDGIGCET